MIDRLTETAPAKLNLALHLTGRRADGYHVLDSLFVYTRTGDRLEVTAARATSAKEVSLEIDGPFAGDLLSCGGADNLVVKAAYALRAAIQDQSGRAVPGAALRLVKILPVAAGIGGGSSDAAATLRLLQRFWRCRVAPERLAALAVGLGADVLPCLDPRPQRITGIGDQVQPLPAARACAVLLLNPLEPLSTPQVFDQYRRAGLPFGAPLSGSGLAAAIAGRNDLEAATFALMPQLKTALAALAGRAGVRLARMTGSGPTLFALFDTDEAARDALIAVRRCYPRWWWRRDRVAVP